MLKSRHDVEPRRKAADFRTMVEGMSSQGSLPQGTVTFLFTDIEGSTRLLSELGEEYADVLAEHRRVLRDAFARHGGVEVDTQGDGFFVVFAKASDAVAAADAAREALAGGPVRVRMGLHTGEPVMTDEGYVGMDVHRAARIAAAGHGGQILLSQSTRDLAASGRLRDLGEHRLKDLAAPERLYQLGDDEFPPLKSVDQTNLPVQPTPFVGRGRELASVRAMLASHRIVTLTGPGGSGKTRLALQVAAESVEEYGDGVWFISLDAVRDPQLIEPTVARVVGGPDDLHAFLAGKRTLLVLDNLEQLLPGAAEILARLEATILATSRSRINIAAEQEFPVPTLPVDEAASLFTHRARQLEPSFEPDASVREIAERLDGLPLAVELAAARVKVLTPAQILERLGRSLDLLTSGAHDAPERQRTLRGTIEWSLTLLTAQEQELFTHLAIFAGSFDLDAAEAVCAANLDVLQSLVDKSLLRHGAGGRFFTLATIKELALERLRDSGETSALQRRHDNHFLGVAEQLREAERRSGPRDLGPESVARFGYELPNFRTAVRRLLDMDRPEEALRLGVALCPFWLGTTQYRDAAEWLAGAPLDDTHTPTEVRAAALAAAGSIAYYVHDDVDRAETLWQSGLELQRDQNNPREIGAAFSRLASVAWRRDDYEGAIELHQQALALFEEASDEPARINELHFLGEAYRDRGDVDTGERLLEQAVSLAHEHGLRYQQMNTLHSLGDLALDRGDVDKALQRFGEALATTMHNRRVQIYCIAGIACALLEQADDRSAARLWGIAEDQEHRFGFRMLMNERRRYEQLMNAARERLGSEYETHHRAGEGLTLDQAVAEARLHLQD